MSDQGKKRYRITFEEPVEVLDDAGQPVVVWETFRTNEPAQFTPMGGVEVMRGRQLEARTKAVFRVNYREGYTPQMRIVFNCQTYGITHINQVDGLRRELEILTTT